MNKAAVALDIDIEDGSMKEKKQKKLEEFRQRKMREEEERL